MEKIRKRVKFTNNDIYLNIFLNETFTLTGSYQTDNQSIIQNTSNGQFREITGISESRLVEVETYDITTPYKLNVNGVTDIVYNANGTINYIDYVLDQINYRTFLPDEFTIYTYIISTVDLTYDNFSLIKDDTLLGITDEPKIDNQIFIERQNVQVKDPHIRIQYINNIGDLISYGGGNYFNIIT